MTENAQMNVSLNPVMDESWTATITPHRGWFDWRLKQLWRYRDLISLFVWRDFVSVYKQTILGPAWHIIQPLLTTITFTVIFGKVAKISTNGVSPFLFYLVGTVFWGYFANNLTKTSGTFVSNAYLLGKVYFHRLTIPISVAISNLITLGIQLGIFLMCFAFEYARGSNVHFTIWVLLTPFFLFILGGYALGFGIIVSALTTRYRDLGNLVNFGVTLGMYATPVIYPVSAVPAHYRWVTQINPLTVLMEGFRLAFLGVGQVDVAQLAASFGIMLVVNKPCP